MDFTGRIYDEFSQAPISKGTYVFSVKDIQEKTTAQSGKRIVFSWSCEDDRHKGRVVFENFWIEDRIEESKKRNVTALTEIIQSLGGTDRLNDENKHIFIGKKINLNIDVDATNRNVVRGRIFIKQANAFVTEAIPF